MKKVVVCPEILRSNLQRTLVTAVFQVAGQKNSLKPSQNLNLKDGTYVKLL